MTEKSLSKSAILMVLLVATAVITWELYLRNKGVTIAYDDGPPLWADKRAKVYAPPDQSVVFVGSSRIKSVWPVLRLDSSSDSLTRCASPPDSVVALCPRRM